MLEQRGAVVYDLPTIAIDLPESCDQLDEALRTLDRYDWVGFSSRNAVRAVFERLDALGPEHPLPPCLNVGAVGPSTAADLAERGIRVRCVPEEAGGSELAAAMAATGIRGSRILLPVGDRARPELGEGLEAAGAEVARIIAYRTVASGDIDREPLDRLERGEIDVVALASPSAFDGLMSILGSGESSLRHARLVCIGPATAAAVHNAGFEPAAIAQPHSVEALADAIVTLFLPEVHRDRS